jgi:hypothetical protein
MVVSRDGVLEGALQIDMRGQPCQHRLHLYPVRMLG